MSTFGPTVSSSRSPWSSWSPWSCLLCGYKKALSICDLRILDLQTSSFYYPPINCLYPQYPQTSKPTNRLTHKRNSVIIAYQYYILTHFSQNYIILYINLIKVFHSVNSIKLMNVLLKYLYKLLSSF